MVYGVASWYQCSVEEPGQRRAFSFKLFQIEQSMTVQNIKLTREKILMVICFTEWFKSVLQTVSRCNEP